MILIDEPTAALRVLRVRLLDTPGTSGLPNNHSWSAAEVKVCKPGTITFVSTVNLPVALTGGIGAGAAGSFDLQLDLAEVAAEGVGRVQFAPAGGSFAEFTYEVRSHALDLVLNPNANLGTGRLARECINLAASYAAADARGLDGPVGSIDQIVSAPTVAGHAIEFTIQSGKRTVTLRQG